MVHLVKFMNKLYPEKKQKLVKLMVSGLWPFVARGKVPWQEKPQCSEAMMAEIQVGHKDAQRVPHGLSGPG